MLGCGGGLSLLARVPQAALPTSENSRRLQEDTEEARCANPSCVSPRD